MNAIVQTMQGLGSVRVITLSVVGAVLLGVFAFLSVQLTSPVLSPLYTNLTSDDSGAIVTELGAMGIDFEVGSGGTEIRVPSNEVLKVRMLLAQKGLPSQGSIVGYEIFDRDTALGTSNFVLNVNLLRALEGELGRTISSLASIKSARVHLVVPKKTVFERGKIEPSASVVLTVNSNLKVPKEEAVAVKHLVSSAVPGLKPSNITVVDNSGNVLAKGSGESGKDGDMAITPENSLEFQMNYEHRMKQTIENLLEQALGEGRVKAEVSAEIGFDRIVTSTEEYDPDGQVARSVQTSEETSNSGGGGGGGSVSVANSLPGGGAAGAGGGGSSAANRVDEVTNYEISKTVTNKVSEVGTIEKVSVAVLVDGRYTTKMVATSDGSEEEQRIYEALSDEEIEQITRLVETAMGYDADRGDTVEIVNMQFNRDMDLYITEEGPFDWLKRDLSNILKTFMIGIVAILAILLVIRPLVNKAFDVTQADIDQEETPTMEYKIIEDDMNDDFDLEAIQSSMQGSPTKRVNDIADNNPEETLAVIRSWLAHKG